MTRRIVVLAVAALLVPGALFAQAAAERLRNAKALFFDQKYAQARQEWQALRSSGGGPEAQSALYWIARCSERLGESDRALAEYGEFLAARPADRTLVEDARTSRVGLAVKLAKLGNTRQLGIAREGLADPSKTVRYFSALQLASLGAEQGRPAVPVLKEILTKEKDEDLVERAKLGLLRVDPSALSASPSPAPRGASREASWIRVRIYEKGVSRPQVAINLPVAVADLVFRNLPEDARAELHKKGIDAGNFWERLKKTGPTDILTIEGEDGERVQVWIE